MESIDVTLNTPQEQTASLGKDRHTLSITPKAPPHAFNTSCLHLHLQRLPLTKLAPLGAA